MEEKEVRIPILGVIDEDKLENREDMHLFKTYTHGGGIYLIKSNLRITLRHIYKSRVKKDGEHYAIWEEIILPLSIASIAIEDIKKEQKTQLKEALNSLHDDLHNNVIGRLQSIEETLKQLTEAHTQLTENGSTSGSGITEKTLLEALAIVTKKV